MVWTDPQARLFLAVTALTLLGTQMQDVLMEPYAGLTATSLLAQTVDFTRAQSAGLLLGVWGLGFHLGRALANLLGAGLVDVLNRITGEEALFAYGGALRWSARS